MARQFIFKSNEIIKVSIAYLNDVLCKNNIDLNALGDNLRDIESKDNEIYKLTGDELKHIQILRYKEEDHIIVNNMDCIIVYMSKDFAVVIKIKDLEEKGRPSIGVTLYPAFLKSDKMDYLVQKSIELGVTNIVPFFSKNTIVKLDNKDRIKRKDKLQKICIEATKQCGRTDEVNVSEFIDFNEMLNVISKHEFCIFAYENETSSIKSVIDKLKENNIHYKDIAIIVGPEGGFDNKEADKLKEISNVHTVSLGERILRAETASVNLISILMYEFDND